LVVTARQFDGFQHEIAFQPWIPIGTLAMDQLDPASVVYAMAPDTAPELDSEAPLTTQSGADAHCNDCGNCENPDGIADVDQVAPPLVVTNATASAASPTGSPGTSRQTAAVVQTSPFIPCDEVNPLGPSCEDQVWPPSVVSKKTGCPESTPRIAQVIVSEQVREGPPERVTGSASCCQVFPSSRVTSIAVSVGPGVMLNP
jgi:hypothetical protein